MLPKFITSLSSQRTCLFSIRSLCTVIRAVYTSFPISRKKKNGTVSSVLISYWNIIQKLREKKMKTKICFRIKNISDKSGEEPDFTFNGCSRCQRYQFLRMNNTGLIILQIHQTGSWLAQQTCKFPVWTATRKQGRWQLKLNTDSLELPLGSVTGGFRLAYRIGGMSHNFAFTESFDRVGTFP